MGSGPPYPVSSRRPGSVPLARHNRVRRRSAETCPSPFSRQPRSSDLFRRGSTSRCDQYPILAGRAGGSDGNSLSAASARWRSRRNSFMRARIIPKSSAARGWIIGSSRSPDLVLTAARSRLRADCKAQRSSVNFPRQVLPPGLSGTAFLAIPGSRTTITPRSPRSLSVRLQTFRYRGTDGSNPVPSSRESTSHGILPSHGEKPAFSRGCVGPAGAARSAETGIARCMAPTGGNISVGPNSSTAASMRRWLNEFRSGSGKAEHGPLLVPGKR